MRPGAHEEGLSELKSSLAFASIPAWHNGADSAWRQQVAPALNLLTNFRIEGRAQRRPRSFRGAAPSALEFAQTLRFGICDRAGSLLHPNASTILRLAAKPQPERAFMRVAQRLPKAA